VARVAASGPDVLTVAIRGSGEAVTPSIVDSLGRRSDGARDGAPPLSEVPGAVFLPLGAPASAPHLALVTAPEKAPYTLLLSRPAELSVSFPRGGSRFSRATTATTHPARVLVDFSRDEIVVEEDVDGDGDYEQPRTAAASDFAPEGARLLSANVVGPETLDGAMPLGLQVALLFDRLVDPETSALPASYQVGDNGVAAAKRQLSGRLVFASLKRPEGPYVPATITANGVRDARGVAGPTVTVPLQSRVTDVGAIVSGRVVEADGQPLAGVLVRYLNAHTCQSATRSEVTAIPTGPDGRYQIHYVRQHECGGPFELAVFDPVTGARRSVQLHVRAPGE
ncbi:MAG TPA: hypothetical protein VFO85_04725, partial [Vicinamibacteria bacterium]|nr:hypothetical protein [Vicinamibacteria bacterium]